MSIDHTQLYLALKARHLANRSEAEQPEPNHQPSTGGQHDLS